jgi:hypothetical protein
MSRRLVNYLAVGLLCCLPTALFADQHAHPFRDYPVKSYPAQMPADLPEESVARPSRSLDCKNSPIVSLLQTVLPEQTDNRTAYVMHIGKWESRGGVYALDSSRWYVYRMLRKTGKGGQLDCTFVQTGFNADGTPVIYADKTVWLIGINYFDKPTDPGAITLGYKLSNIPIAAQNIQDFGALIAGVLNATVPSVGGAVQPNVVTVSAGPVTVPSFITVARFDLMKHFPQNLTFAFSLSVNQVGALPPARLGVPYSASATASGGTGVYSYSIVGGFLPPGIGLDPVTGAISGTPTARKSNPYEVFIKAADTSDPPNEVTTDASIDVADSVYLQPLSVSSAPTIAQHFPDARVDTDYSLTVIPPSTLTVPYTLSLDTGKSVNAGWVSLDASTGLIHGKPLTANAGTSTVTINVSDLSNPPKILGVAAASFYVWPASPGAAVAPSAIKLPDATVGTPYHSGLALGSLGNATLTESGDLPQGLTFNPFSGEISGTVLDARDAGKTFLFSVQVGSTPQGQSAPVVGQVLTFSLNVPAVNPSNETDDDDDVTVDFPKDGTDLSFGLPRSAAVGQSYSATVKVVGPDGKYLIVMPCEHEKPEKEGEPRTSPGCMARRWFNLSPSFTLKNEAGGKTVLTTLSGDENELDLEAIPWLPGETNLAFEICKESAQSLKDVSADKKKEAARNYSERDCDKNFKATIEGLIEVDAPPLQALTMTLGASSPQSASGPSSHGGQPAASPASSSPSPAAAAGPGSAGPSKGGSQNNSGGGGKNPGGTPAPAASTPTGPQNIDCSVVSSQTPCAFSDTFVNNDREAFDFSIGVNLPGVKEAQYAPAAKLVTHTDLYALVDIYPLAMVQHFTNWSPIAYMPSKESWLPHFNFGIPVANQPFHRPIFAIAENLTTWTRLEKLGFPIRINAFAGLVCLKQQINSTGSQYDRAWKPAFGIEVPVSALASKISSSLGGSSSKSSSSGGKTGQ